MHQVCLCKPSAEALISILGTVYLLMLAPVYISFSACCVMTDIWVFVTSDCEKKPYSFTMDINKKESPENQIAHNV